MSQSARQQLVGAHAGRLCDRVATPLRAARLPRRFLLLAALVAALLALPCPARASELDELVELQSQATEARSAYDEANKRISELEAEMAQAEERLAELEAEMPELKERASQSVRQVYKMQQGSGSLLALILSAEDFNQVLTTIEYLQAIQTGNAVAMNELVAATTEVQQTQGELAAQAQQAEAARAEAESALTANEQAQEQLEAKIAQQAATEAAEREAAVERARAEAEAAAQAAAEAAEQEGSSDEDSAAATFTTESGSEATIEVPESSSPSTVESTSDRDSFVSTWASRIDAYLAGSPLAGMGQVFAEAAYDYGVDPRLSPAISTVESSTGRYCFKSHNAWGWGSSSWDSWEEAIRAHVAGLASGYGGQLTYAGAQKYCPPSADAWYSSVLAEMERI